MKPTTLTIFELFEKERRYAVPLFQRPYVWERQWSHLWEDVVTRANAILEREDDSYALRKHFLGAVVLNQAKTYGRQVPTVEVIDGQQRLTTLQILLAALRDVLAAMGDDGYETTLTRITVNTCRMENDYERFKVWPTNADRAFFERTVTAGSREEVLSRFPLTRKKYARKWDPRPRLVEAYLYFHKVIHSFLKVDEDEEQVEGAKVDTRQRVDALVEAISNHLELVVIELEERDDPQAIFESLNGLGEPLLPSDLIRNFVFQQATRLKVDVEKLYGEHWSQFDKSEFWQVEERQGRLKRKRFDLFVYHYLVKETERDLNIGQLYQDFKDWWYRGQREVTSELARLERESEHFQLILAGAERWPFFKRLKAADTSTVYPVLLAVFEEVGLPDSPEAGALLNVLESYLIRRLVCGLTPKNYNRVFLSLLKLLRREGFSAEAAASYLTSLDGDSVRWPNDLEFQEAWLTRPVYETIGAARSQIILGALDVAMRTKLQEDISITGWISVEHVLPQAWSEAHYPLPEHDSHDPTARAQVLNLRQRILHTFGNLTLITGYLNSSVSNAPFEVKRSRITENSAFRLNTYFQSIDGRWDEKAILARGRALFEVARECWPHPVQIPTPSAHATGSVEAN